MGELVVVGTVVHDRALVVIGVGKEAIEGGGLRDEEHEQQAGGEDEGRGDDGEAIAGFVEEGFHAGEDLLAATGARAEGGDPAGGAEFGNAGEGGGVGFGGAELGDDPIVTGDLALAFDLAANPPEGGLDGEEGAEEALEQAVPIVTTGEMAGFVEDDVFDLGGREVLNQALGQDDGRMAIADGDGHGEARVDHDAGVTIEGVGRGDIEKGALALDAANDPEGDAEAEQAEGGESARGAGEHGECVVLGDLDYRGREGLEVEWFDRGG